MVCFFHIRNKPFFGQLVKDIVLLVATHTVNEKSIPDGQKETSGAVRAALFHCRNYTDINFKKIQDKVHPLDLPSLDFTTIWTFLFIYFFKFCQSLTHSTSKRFLSFFFFLIYFVLLFFAARSWDLRHWSSHVPSEEHIATTPSKKRRIMSINKN